MADLDKLRHAQIVRVDDWVLLQWMRNDVRVQFEPPLPTDAEIVALQPEWASNAVEFKVVSWAWAPIPRGEIPPRWEGRVRVVQAMATFYATTPTEERKDGT